MHDPTDSPAVASAQVASVGQRLSPEIYADLKKLYAPLQLRPLQGVPGVVRNLAYGPHPRHRLNLFPPAGETVEAKWALVFMHGGGFVTGDKEETPDVFYDNVGIWATAQGMIGITINYRLAPEHGWPAGREDVAAALAWVRSNVSQFYGDPQRIVLMGHSAGATHVASYVAHAGTSSGIAGCVCVSGMYDLNIAPVNAAYFGADASAYPERSPLAGLARTATPLLITFAEQDPAVIQRHALSLFAARLETVGVLPAIAQLRGHNHFSGILHLNSPDLSLSQELKRFIGGLCPSP